MVIESELGNLWPTLDEIGVGEIIPPVVILREQAEFIGNRTSNILEGQIKNERVYRESLTWKSQNTDLDSNRNSVANALANVGRWVEDTSSLEYAFFLRPVALGDVKVRLFSVIHNVALVYPVTFKSAIKMSETETKEATASNEHEFREILRNFFHSDSVKRVLQSLIAQSR